MSNVFFYYIGIVVVYGAIAIPLLLLSIYIFSRVNQYFQIIGSRKWFFKIFYLKSYWSIKRCKIALERMDKSKFDKDELKQIKDLLNESERNIRIIDAIFKGDK